MNNFDDVLVELDTLSSCAEPSPLRGWPIPKVLVHCAQSIDASIDGYPKMKPALLRKTIGRLVARRFLAKGSFSHDIESPIPGGPEISESDLVAAVATLRTSIQRFRDNQGPLAPHFVFDALDKDAYERIHAMHIADHLGAIRYR